jgi:predicted nuclease with RNAse H fold
VAIDAPLAFPSAFVELLAQGMLPVMTGTREIDNPLAYRDCDRFIARTHGKKPLSASFDKLGNNATVAMTVTRRWRAQGFRVVPFDDPGDGRRLALETYPALFKRAGVVVERARALLPRGLHDGTDEQDAALCALAAVAYSGAEDSRLPKLVPPPSGEGKDGWIFGPTRAWFDDG